MANYRYHMCLDLEGTMRNAKTLKGCLIREDGSTIDSVAEIKKWAREQIAMGRRVYPCGDCDNFDYQKGCRGHLIEKTKGDDNGDIR